MKVNLTSYSGSVSGGDWKPAFEAAWNAIKATGGTIVVDTDDAVIKSQANLSPASYLPVGLKIVGDGGNKVRIDCADTVNAFYFGNLLSLDISDMIFTGTGIATSQVNCQTALFATSCGVVTLQNTHLAGLGVKNSGVTFYNCGKANINHSRMCGGMTSGANAGMIMMEQGSHLSINDVHFIDYENFRADYWSKTPNGVLSWIRANNPLTSVIGNGANHPTIHISDCRFDEGAQTHIYIDGYPNARIERCNSNVFGPAGGNGYTLKNMDEVSITNCNFGYTSQDNPAVIRENVDRMTMLGCSRDHGVTRIVSDTADGLKILNSPGFTVDLP